MWVGTTVGAFQWLCKVLILYQMALMYPIHIEIAPIVILQHPYRFHH